MNLGDIAKLFGYSHPSLQPILGVSIDSRLVKPGYLFLALKGGRFDGHDYIQSAVTNGAVAIICERSDSFVGEALQLQVDDSVQALGRLAHFHRKSLSSPMIAITGSNGKTTVKEMVAAILPPPALTTAGNFNNHIGAPLSVLQLTHDHQYAAFELGANHLGEIDYTTKIVQPNAAVITNIGPAHLEGFGSIDNVARAKGEIYQGLTADGVAVINADDKYAHFWDEIVKDKKTIRFSKQKTADVCAKNSSINAQGYPQFTLVLPDESEYAVSLKIPGEHSISNALAAASVCFAVGIDGSRIAEKLTSFSGVAGRMALLAGLDGCTIIDDTYNANLSSVLAAISVLARRPGVKILVLGDLAELGDSAQLHHETIGESARQQGINYLFTYGKLSVASAKSFGKNAEHYTDQIKLARDLLVYLHKDCTVLVKGSRSAAMEKVVHQLLQ